MLIINRAVSFTISAHLSASLSIFMHTWAKHMLAMKQKICSRQTGYTLQMVFPVTCYPRMLSWKCQRLNPRSLVCKARALPLSSSPLWPSFLLLFRFQMIYPPHLSRIYILCLFIRLLSPATFNTINFIVKSVFIFIFKRKNKDISNWYTIKYI